MTTKSDRELLEAAARAAGVDASWINDPDYESRNEGMWMNGARSQDNSKYWNPLRDDGDESRLEAALSLDVQWRKNHVIVGRQHVDGWMEPYSQHGGDKQKARRYAGVRAAAAIGAHKEGG